MVFIDGMKVFHRAVFRAVIHGGAFLGCNGVAEVITVFAQKVAIVFCSLLCVLEAKRRF